ncbi:MAG: hypothetical protein ACXV3V_09795 [Actinomycetes bacterium]
MTNRSPSSALTRRQRSASGRSSGPPSFLDDMHELAAAADRAPSPIDRKPWRLRARGGAVELLADASYRTDDRELRRQIVLACGASLFNLRLAMAHLGLHPVVTQLPTVGEPDLLARIEPGKPVGSDLGSDLYLALATRRTRQDPFAHPVVPSELLDQLTAAVAREGASLVPVATDLQRRTMDTMMTEALSRPGATDSLRGRPRAAWVDGSSGTLVLLVTPDDTICDWLRAGQALQRLLLTATTLWLDARFHTRVLEDPGLREQVRGSLCPDAYPQLVLELGQS